MATAAEAIEEMAKATGIPPVNLEWAAINLRKDRRNGWPIGGRGGGINSPAPQRLASRQSRLGKPCARAAQ